MEMKTSYNKHFKNPMKVQNEENTLKDRNYFNQSLEAKKEKVTSWQLRKRNRYPLLSLRLSLRSTTLLALLQLDTTHTITNNH